MPLLCMHLTSLNFQPFFQDVINQLEDKSMISDRAAEALTFFQDTSIPSQLVKRSQKNRQLKIKNRESYSPEFRQFATTLSFYSAKAYAYVGEEFHLPLPSPTTLLLWESSVDGAPGFTVDLFQCLKAKVDEERLTNTRKASCAFTLDEMSIKKCTEYDGKHFYGYVDVGANSSDLD